MADNKHLGEQIENDISAIFAIWDFGGCTIHDIGMLICVFGGLALMYTPVQASVEDTTSYCKACSFFTLRQIFLDDGDGGAVTPSPVNPPLLIHDNKSGTEFQQK